MTKIIRAGWVDDARTYVPRIIACEMNTELEIATYVANFVDGLRKGWHVASVQADDDGNIVIDVKKSE